MPRRKTTDTVQLKLRFREELRRKLEREAKRQERSLNNEIVGRLERSFEEEARIDDALGGPENSALLRMVAAEMDWARARHGAVLDEGDLTLIVTSAIMRVLVEKMPGIHSVEIAMLNKEGGAGNRANILSSAATSASFKGEKS